MLHSPSATIADLNMVARPAAKPVLPRLVQALAMYRQRRIEWAMAEMVLRLDHPGIAEDLRMARGPYRG
jgi:hypothetical protein